MSSPIEVLINSSALYDCFCIANKPCHIFAILQDIPEYMNMLAFLKSGQKDNSGYVDTADALEMSKIRFAHHIAYERKADSSKFLEHWVPAYISQVQLGVYCSILLSNSSVLQSKKKADSAEALRDILLSLSKVCFATIHACMAINRQPICNCYLFL